MADTNLNMFAKCKHLIIQDTDGFQQGTEKLVPQYEKWYSFGGDCMEMQWERSAIKCELLLLQLQLKKTKYSRARF
jgi:hypothetical protein